MSTADLSLRARRALRVAVVGAAITASFIGGASTAHARALPGDPGAPVSGIARSLDADPPVATGGPADAPAPDDATPSPGTEAPEPDAEPSKPAEPKGLFEHCPLMGPSTFEDSWGWARSGGRRHEGVDMMAARGTWIIAVRDGFAQFKTNSLGGRAIWLTAPNGDKFYYAHLDAWEGESREVEASELIGYVGTSGNAGTPHLHFETLPGGIVENPYPHTLRACVPTPEELAAAGLSLEGSQS